MSRGGSKISSMPSSLAASGLVSLVGFLTNAGVRSSRTLAKRCPLLSVYQNMLEAKDVQDSLESKLLTELMASVLAVGDRMVAQIKLDLDDLVDSIILYLAQLGVLGNLHRFPRVHLDTLVAQGLRAEQRAHVLGPKGRALVVV